MITIRDNAGEIVTTTTAAGVGNYIRDMQADGFEFVTEVLGMYLFAHSDGRTRSVKAD